MDVREYGRRRSYSPSEDSWSDAPSTPDEHRRASYEDSYERGRRAREEEAEMDEDA